MKIAVCYRGFYYRDLNKPQSGGNLFCCYKNHLVNFFDFLPSYDIFLHTYSVSKENDAKLLERLNPKKYIIEDEPHDRISYSIIESSKLVDMSEYDFIFNLRYDLWFLKPISYFNIDFNSFNFVFKDKIHKWKRMKYTSDLFYGYDARFLDDFISASVPAQKRCRSKGSLHHLYNHLVKKIGESNVNFMVNGYQSSFNSVDEKTNDYIMINRHTH